MASSGISQLALFENTWRIPLLATGERKHSYCITYNTYVYIYYTIYIYIILYYIILYYIILNIILYIYIYLLYYIYIIIYTNGISPLNVTNSLQCDLCSGIVSISSCWAHGICEEHLGPVGWMFF